MSGSSKCLIAAKVICGLFCVILLSLIGGLVVHVLSMERAFEKYKYRFSIMQPLTDQEKNAYRKVPHLIQVDSQTKKASFKPDPRAKRPPRLANDDDVAFVFVGMGAFARQLKCEAAIESLQKIGGWVGDIYLLTDAPQCYRSTLPNVTIGDVVEVGHGEVVAGDEKATYLRINGDSEDAASLRGAGTSYSGGGSGSSGGDGLMDVKVRSVKVVESYKPGDPNAKNKESRIAGKMMKARVFKEVPNPNIEYIVFLDCDILFQKQGCAKTVVDEVVRSPWSKGNIRMKQNGMGQMHAGTLVMHREKSKEALQRWEDSLATYKYGNDRDAYKAAWAAANETGDHTMDIDWYPHEYEQFLNVHKSIDDTSCMAHISHSRCLWQGRNMVDEYVEQLDLSTYDDGKGGRLHYCEHPTTWVYSYDWIKQHGCQKIETLI